MEDAHFGLTSSDMLANLAGAPSASIGWAFPMFCFYGCRLHVLFQSLVLSCLVATHHASCQQGHVAHMIALPHSWLPQDGGSVSDGKLPASSQSGAAASGKGGPMSSCDGSLPASAAPGAAASSKDTVLPTCDRPEEEAVCQGHPDLPWPCDEELQDMMEASLDFA